MIVELIADSFLYVTCTCIGFFFAVCIYCLAVEAQRSFFFQPVKGKLYASPQSTCSMRSIMALVETKADFSFHLVDLAKKHQKEPWYLQIQPYGKVPVWEEGSGGAKFRMFESRAILKHVTAGSLLYPLDDRRFVATIEMSWVPIFQEKILKKRANPKYVANEKLCQEKAEELCRILDQMETRLQKAKYIAGTRFSIADITYLPYFALFEQAGLKETLAARPNLQEWVTCCLSRKSWEYVSKHKVLERSE
jgi:glutathione S-transferase